MPLKLLSSQIENVFLGKKVFIDWKSGLEPAIFVRYSTPAGDPLIHKSPNPVFMPNYPGWGFYSFNPWRPRFDEVIQMAIEGGLVDRYSHNKCLIFSKMQTLMPVA